MAASAGGLVSCLLSTALLAGALSGCKTPPHGLSLETIGPIYRHGWADDARGYLQVYSATEDFNDGNVHYYPHTSYEVWSAEGKFVKGVVNHIGLNDERPMTVPLLAGSYVVYAQAEGCGLVQVPVQIRRSWLTAVYLERRGMPASLTLNTNEWVRLPDGRIVGPRPRQRPVE